MLLGRSGQYAYDGAGNIKQIGSRLYRYDRVGRLVWDTETPRVRLPKAS